MNKENKPRKYDFVLGGNNPPPIDGVVLGGIQGVEKRLSSQNVETKLAAVVDALKYGNEGIELIIRTLKNSSESCQDAVARIIKQQGSLEAKQALLDYNPYLFFTTLKNWNWQKAYPKIKIKYPHNTAYIVRYIEVHKLERKTKKRYRLDGLQELLQDKQVSKIEALIFKIDCDDREAFKICAKTVCDANQSLISLKSLFIGDGEEIWDLENVDNQFIGSNLSIFDLQPFFEFYPNLEVLQVRGDFNEYPRNCENLNHENLKTLIIETSDLHEYNLNRIGNSNLPKLEYLEIWIGRRLEDEVNSLSSILNYDSFPNLKYLGLKGSLQSDRIAQAIVNSPILKHLSVLDLSMGLLTDTGAEALLNCSAIEKFHTLDISYNTVSESAISRLSELSCNLIADNQRAHLNNDYYEPRWE